MKRFIKYGNSLIKNIFRLFKTICHREHRRWIIEKLDKPLKEILFIDNILSVDNKNYHAWSYRFQNYFSFIFFIKYIENGLWKNLIFLKRSLLLWNFI